MTDHVPIPDAELAEMKQETEDGYPPNEDEALRLIREVEELRAALREIAEPFHTIQEMRAKARAALGQEP